MLTLTRVRPVAETSSAVLAFAGAIVTARMDAGLAGAWVLVGLGSAIPLYVLARGWRLAWWLTAVAAALPLGVVLTALVHGYGEGAARAARYAWVAILFLAIVAWARTPSRRLAAAGGVLVLVADIYLTGWWIWWGGDDPSRRMYGNFYMPNQFGIVMAVGMLVAAAIVVLGRRLLVVAAVLVACLAGAGLIASASRASIALGAAAFVVIVLFGVVARRWWGLVRGVLLAAAILGAAMFMASSVFFPVAAAEGVGFGSGLADRSSASSSWGARVVYWIYGLRMGVEAPLAGVGLQGFGPHLECMITERYSSNPHNEFVLAWAETGLLGAVPFAAVLVGVGVLVIRSFRRDPDAPVARRVRWFPSAAELLADPVRWGALVATFIAVGHLAFDFDGCYPALLAVVGLVAGLAAAPVLRMRWTPLREVATWVGPALALVLVVMGVLGFVIDPIPGDPLMPHHVTVGCPA